MTIDEMGIVFEQKRPELLKIARRYDFEMAEDFVQDTALKALENVDKFRGGNVGGWLNKILSNIAKNHLAKESVRCEYEREEEVCFLSTKIDIDKALSYLNEQQRQAITLYMKGYNNREISENIKVPLGTVQSRIYYGCEKLRKIL